MEDHYQEGTKVRYSMDNKIYRIKKRDASGTILEEENENRELVVKGESYLQLFFQLI